MKKKHITIMLLITVFSAGCAEMNLFVKDEMRGSGPSKILIGEFITRDMSYDPFLADGLTDSVRFEFFSRGYNVQVWKRSPEDKKMYDTPSDTAALCAGASADVLITGVISRKESGSFADRRVYYSVTFIIRNKSGNITGEGNYRDTNIDEPVFVKEAAGEFVKEFINRTIDE